uniref:CSON015579 protein n=1 Tax=Culicoides sonorensis TaxID=179676 RepID=A0A336KWU7_CULSO
MMKIIAISGILLFTAQYAFGAAPRTTVPDFVCPKENGRYADPKYCEKYYLCEDGEATSEVCPNGLVYDDSLSVTSLEYPCVHLRYINCGDRALPIPNNSTPDCSYDFETKPTGYPNECNKYRICSNGIGTDLSCPPNLAYNIETETCEWPDLVEACNATAFMGFECPPNVKEGSYFENPKDCGQYFICNNGRPRWMICAEGLMFDPCRIDCVKPADLKCGLCKEKKIE